MGGSMKIYKFGGTSLGSASRIKKVADIIAGALADDKLIVVDAGGLFNYARKTGMIAK